MEIQKAEEFYDNIDGLTAQFMREEINPRELTIKSIALIRARDKAIVERCKIAVHDITTNKKMSGEGSWGWMEARFAAESAVDAILRDLD